ncbi:hypothetical protein LOC68_06245 [Blastopirellula sp. JC732]|uniref:DUF6798 domain-containing protein n=1 Tax=Blastopirellula sediminis TaxID=2894196 RepID=A0A9X1SID7_9BACT|nr:DUF6798 domain-containing protein [Blastopirellula sediminis]MCC9609234.1 hypothetical protein [Blastopirellula sediminis]MCC9627989.1 hypothetical protein [Blastopirellula sediminis]
MNQATPAETPPASSAIGDWRWFLLETLAITLIFALYVATLGPEVNEPHYLCKAKHYWNPQWLPNDFFLSAPGAHYTFYWTLGWLTLFLPLPVVAWIGRLISWLALAAAWRYLSFLLIPRHWCSVATAVIWLATVHYGHLAGEWAVGGVEGKTFAYPFVLLALGLALQNRWNPAWVSLGIASAFHILVGGWSVVALGIAWLLVGRKSTSFFSMLTGLMGGGLISLLGLVPALLLTAGVPPDMQSEAHQLYVFYRLPHHLVVHRMDPLRQFCFATVTAGWAIFAWSTRRDPRMKLVNAFAIGSLVIAGCGVAIDQVFCYWLSNFDLAAKLLRFYWFRLSDVAVPLGLALSVGLRLFVVAEEERRSLVRRASIAIVLLATTIALGIRIQARLASPIPPADDMASVSDYTEWLAMCRWIRENTPADATFLTPLNQGSFKWDAQRSEVVTHKDVPQEALSLLGWKERRWRTMRYERLTSNQIRLLSRDYHFGYVVVDTHSRPDFAGWDFPRVYPVDENSDSPYEIFRVQ